MRKLRTGILLLVTIIALSGAASQTALADSHTSGRMVVVLADPQGVSESEGGIDLVKSFLGLASTLRDGELFAFVNLDEPTEFLGPALPEDRSFKTLREDFENGLESSTPDQGSHLVAALAAAYNLLGSGRANPGSTVYIVTGGTSDADLAQLEANARPVVSLFKDKGWPIVGLRLPGTAQEVSGFLDTVSTASGGESFELSAPDGLKRLSDKMLTEGAKGSLVELSQSVLSSSAVLTSSLGIAPGTSEETLLFFKEGTYGSLRLTNSSGFETSAGDRTVSGVIETPHVVIWRLTDPAPGQWRVDVSGIDGVVSVWHYSANKYGLAFESFGAVPLDEPATLVAFATDGSEKIVLDGAVMTARITAPDGATLVHELNDDGVSGDAVPGDGYFSATISPVATEGEYKVELGLSWPQLDHRISSHAAFRAQAFPAIELTPVSTGDLQPGERAKVATMLVHVQGQPYAIPTEELSAALSSNTDQAGTLEIKPQRLLDVGRAWEYDLFFTPDDQGLHTLVIRLSMEYAGKQYGYTSDSMVLSSVMPEPPAEPVAPSAPVQPPPALEVSPPQPSGFPWRLMSGSIAVGAVLLAVALYWRTRVRPYGYLYDDRDDLVVDFANLKRRPIMKLVLKNYVRGKELGIQRMEGVRFSFSKSRVGLSSRSVAPTLRVNNQPVVGKATLRHRAWIGIHGKLYSFLLSPPLLRMEPGAGDG